MNLNEKLSIFVGNWELETDDNLEEFLKFYEYNWFSIKAALLASVHVNFSKSVSENSLNRTVFSTFLKGSEKYIFDKEFRLNSENLNKRHSLIENRLGEFVINSEIVKKDNNLINWREQVKIENNKLHLSDFGMWAILNIAVNRYLKKFLKINNYNIQTQNRFHFDYIYLLGLNLY